MNPLANCILCGRPAVLVGVFAPDRPERFGLGAAPAGKVRRYAYALCGRHNVDAPAVPLLVVEELDRQIRAAIANAATARNDGHE